MLWLLCVLCTVIHEVIKIFLSTLLYLNVVQGISFPCSCMTTFAGPKALLFTLKKYTVIKILLEISIAILIQKIGSLVPCHKQNSKSHTPTAEQRRMVAGLFFLK